MSSSVIDANDFGVVQNISCECPMKPVCLDNKGAGDSLRRLWAGGGGAGRRKHAKGSVCYWNIKPCHQRKGSSDG